MIAIGVPAACMTVRAAEIPAAPAEDDMAFRMAGVTVEAKRPDWESKLSPGTVTVIRPEEFKGEQKDLADFLKMVPGVHVREVNGKGQNMLGVLLMEVRDEIRALEASAPKASAKKAKQVSRPVIREAIRAAA